MWFGAYELNRAELCMQIPPSFMVYGSEEVLPADLAFGAPMLTFKNIAEAEAIRLEEIDDLEEEQLNVVIQSARYQQTLRCYYDKVIHPERLQ
jgi:hypothetical protein